MLVATSAFADECYVNEEDPSWAVRVRQGGFVWYQGVTSIELGDMSAGTGVSRRVAVTDDMENAYPYLFHKGDLIFDNDVYVPASENKCK